jgi:hypothetical protein
MTDSRLSFCCFAPGWRQPGAKQQARHGTELMLLADTPSYAALIRLHEDMGDPQAALDVCNCAIARNAWRG